MNVQVFCSYSVKDKILKKLSQSDIMVSENAKVALVEKGLELPVGKVSIVFDAIDYLEAIELLIADNKFEDSVNIKKDFTLTGFANNRFTIIKPSDIQYIQANKNKVYCIVDSNEFLLKQPLYHYEKILATHFIVRINKSQLVNLMQVKEIIPWFNSRLVLDMKNGERLEVSKKFASELRKQLGI